MLIASIKKTLEIIRNNRSKVFLLFFLQVLLFASLSVVSYKTLIPAMEHAQSAVDYYDSINMTESSGTFGYYGKDPLAVYNNYSKMMYYLKYMALFSIISFLIVGSWIWALSDNLLVKKSPKQFLHYIFSFIVACIISILVIYTIIFQNIKASILSLESSVLPFIGSLLVLLIILYFIFIALILISKKAPKEILKATFRLGLLKAHYILLIYLVNIIIIALSSSLVYLTIELNMLLLTIAVILWVFSFVFARLFFIVSMDELAKEVRD